MANPKPQLPIVLVGFFVSCHSGSARCLVKAPRPARLNSSEFYPRRLWDSQCLWGGFQSLFDHCCFTPSFSLLITFLCSFDGCLRLSFFLAQYLSPAANVLSSWSCSFDPLAARFNPYPYCGLLPVSRVMPTYSTSTQAWAACLYLAKIAGRSLATEQLAEAKHRVPAQTSCSSFCKAR